MTMSAMNKANMTNRVVPLFERGNADAAIGGGLEVLVVEDDEADAYLIRSALKCNPRIARVALARDGVEALEWLDSGLIQPDVAIVDLHMPRKNGFSLLVDIRCRLKADLKTIVLTSSMACIDAARSKLRGADCFLTKPDTVVELHWALSNAMAPE